MIRMNKYDKTVEKNFLNAVEAMVDIDDRTAIVHSFRKYFPKGVIPEANDAADDFGKLILADYNTLMVLYHGISKTDMKNEVFDSGGEFKQLYQKYHDTYKSLTQKRIGKEKVNVYLVKNSNAYTCPYCNRNYITTRGDDVAGAQLDHFFNKKQFPVFSLCLYNLVPSCSTCNLVKKTEKGLISPFDSELADDFITFEQEGSIVGGNLALRITVNDSRMQKNVDTFRLKEAYEIHSEDLKELLELVEMYPKSQEREICKVMNKPHRKRNGMKKIKAVRKKKFTETDVQNMVFGKQVPYEEYVKKPLTKFRQDILKKLRIFK